MPPGGQQVTVIYGIGPDGRSLIPISVDAAGALSIAGGGIAAAVSIANGSDVAEGATTSAESASGDGTVIGILKNLRTRLVSIIAQLPAALTIGGNLKVAMVESTASQAITIADGSDVAEGATTAAESSSGDGTVVGILKNLRTRLGVVQTAQGTTADTPAIATEDSTARSAISLLKGIKNTLYVSVMGILGATNGAAVTTDVDGTIQQYLRGLVKMYVAGGATSPTVQGNSGHGNVVVGNPLRMAGRATTSEIAAVGDGTIVDLVSDKYGRQLVSLYAPVDRWTSGHPAVVTDNAAHDILVAAGSNLKWYLRSLSVINSHASVDTLVTIQDDSANVLWRVWAKSGGYGEAIVLDPPVPTAANGKLQVICGTTGSSIYVDVSAFKAA